MEKTFTKLIQRLNHSLIQAKNRVINYSYDSYCTWVISIRPVLCLATLTTHIYSMIVSNNSSISLETWWDSSWLCALPEWKSHVPARQNHLRPPYLSVNRSIRLEHLHMNPPPQIPSISYSVLFQECSSFLLSDKMDQGWRVGEFCRGNYVLLDWIILTIALRSIVLRTFLFICFCSGPLVH